ncbi:hypothetical protein [Streptomyces thermocarboxydus]|uniref:hypothetical protein n=1 Tax=Streptomyces TaxID=1883 RepID=UPI00131A0E21|nr:hypothetical protein [Streptomyces sp. McG7]MBT2906350.1 hypothetical protein [Streptomyces sp. McG8]MYQ31326.1 hypothetical protein [Streptomyces sp. SID4956]
MRWGTRSHLCREHGRYPAGTRIGTPPSAGSPSSPCPTPHLGCVPMRGDANRRRERLGASEADGLLLAVAGLERIGRRDVITETLATDVMMPPVGAVVLALRCRRHDTAARARATCPMTTAGACSLRSCWARPTTDCRL